MRLYDGVPPLTAFADGRGGPLVINRLTDTAYYVDGGKVKPLGGGGGGGVTAVTATAPVNSSGGTTPNINLVGLSGYGSPGQAIVVNGAGTALAYATVGGGGLLYWVESQSTTGLNSTVFTSQFIPLTTSTDADAVISPKGNGAFLAQTPDGTTAGGQKRGANAIDLQTTRVNANQVAAGQYNTIVGGYFNRTSGTNTSCFGGNSNYAQSGSATCIGGTGNNAFSQDAICVGGSSNISSNNYAVSMGNACTASGLSSFAGGQQSVASNNYSFAYGDNCIADAPWSRATGAQSITRNLTGARAFSVGKGQFTQGDDQELRMFLQQRTFDNTPIALTTNKGGGGTTNQYVLADNMSSVVRGMVCARDPSGNNAMWEFVAAIKRDTGAASTVMVAAGTVTLIGANAGASAWAVALSADTTNGSLKILFTGSAVAQTIVGCTLTAVEITV